MHPTVGILVSEKDPALHARYKGTPTAHVRGPVQMITTATYAGSLSCTMNVKSRRDSRHHPAKLDGHRRGAEVGDSFDLVTVLFYLHRPLFAEVKRVVRPGGVAVVAIRTKGINPKFCIEPGELREAFAGWEIVHEREDEIAELVARK